MECVKTVFEGDAEYKEIEGYSIWQLSKGAVKKEPIITAIFRE